MILNEKVQRLARMRNLGLSIESIAKIEGWKVMATRQRLQKIKREYPWLIRQLEAGEAISI